MQFMLGMCSPNLVLLASVENAELAGVCLQVKVKGLQRSVSTPPMQCLMTSLEILEVHHHQGRFCCSLMGNSAFSRSIFAKVVQHAASIRLIMLKLLHEGYLWHGSSDGTHCVALHPAEHAPRTPQVAWVMPKQPRLIIAR